MSIRTKIFRLFSLSLTIMTLIASLASCQNKSNLKSISSPTDSASTPSSTEAGKITEIPKQKVWIRQLGSTKEILAREGMDIQVGETIRTENEGKVQIELNNKLAFRLGGNSTVTLQLDNQLNLTDGTMISWVVPGQKVPTEIVTPSGVAGIRGTTVYVEVSPNSNKGSLFFTWEGEMFIHLKGQTSEIVLKTGDEITIKPGEKDLTKISKLIKQTPPLKWRKLRQCIANMNLPDCQKEPRFLLFRDFKTLLPTLSLIDKPLPERTIQAPGFTQPTIPPNVKSPEIIKKEPFSNPKPSQIEPNKSNSSINKPENTYPPKKLPINPNTNNSPVNKPVTSPSPKISPINQTPRNSPVNKPENNPTPEPVNPTPNNSPVKNPENPTTPKPVNPTPNNSPVKNPENPTIPEPVNPNPNNSPVKNPENPTIPEPVNPNPNNSPVKNKKPENPTTPEPVNPTPQPS
jgi:FecR protein